MIFILDIEGDKTKVKIEIPKSLFLRELKEIKTDFYNSGEEIWDLDNYKHFYNDFLEDCIEESELFEKFVDKKLKELGRVGEGYFFNIGHFPWAHQQMKQLWNELLDREIQILKKKKEAI